MNFDDRKKPSARNSQFAGCKQAKTFFVFFLAMCFTSRSALAIFYVPAHIQRGLLSKNTLIYYDSQIAFQPRPRECLIKSDFHISLTPATSLVGSAFSFRESKFVSRAQRKCDSRTCSIARNRCFIHCHWMCWSFTRDRLSTSLIDAQSSTSRYFRANFAFQFKVFRVAWSYSDFVGERNRKSNWKNIFSERFFCESRIKGESARAVSRWRVGWKVFMGFWVLQWFMD